MHGGRPAIHPAAWYLQGIREITDFRLVARAPSSASLQTSTTNTVKLFAVSRFIGGRARAEKPTLVGLTANATAF